MLPRVGKMKVGIVIIQIVFPWLWSNRDYQKRVIDLWTYIADYYKDEEYIAGL